MNVLPDGTAPVAFLWPSGLYPTRQLYLLNFQPSPNIQRPPLSNPPLHYLTAASAPTATSDTPLRGLVT